MLVDLTVKENQVLALASEVDQFVSKIVMNVEKSLYSNGREQGYAYKLDKDDNKVICFSENRNSDHIVIYFGAAERISDSANSYTITDKMYMNKKFFTYFHINEAMEYIKELITV